MSKSVNILLAVGLAFPVISIAQTAGTESRSAIRESFKESPVEKSPEEPETRLTKNWGGARTRLSDAGVDLAAIIKMDLNDVATGGSETGSSALGTLDLRASLDLEKIAGWRGGSFFIYLLGHTGDFPGTKVGDTQGTSNIQAPIHSFKVYEAWFQQEVLSGSASFLFGLHDLNSEFYVTPASSLFLNGSFGVGAELAITGVNGPSVFPVTAPAFRLRVEPLENYYFQSGLFGAVAGDPEKPNGTQIGWKAADGFLFVNEFAYHRGYEGAAAGVIPEKYSLGLWTYTVPVLPIDAIDENVARVGTYGAYALFERGLTADLTSFLRYGVATSKSSELSSNLSAGLNLSNPFEREGDSAGVAFTRAGFGKEFRAETLGSNETTFELTYRAQLIPGIALQPDLQYVIHPSGDLNADNAFIAAARLEISL